MFTLGHAVGLGVISIIMFTMFLTQESKIARIIYLNILIATLAGTGLLLALLTL